MLTKRTDALADRLSKAFEKMNIPPEYATHMKVDKFGNVTAEGPWKAKIEKMFSDDPALAKEMKEVSGLNALKAAQASLDLYNEQKKSTNSEAKQAEAWKNYNIRSMNIQTLSGVMTMKDGKLRSAAVDYMDMIADPTGINAAESRQDFASRLAYTKIGASSASVDRRRIEHLVRIDERDLRRPSLAPGDRAVEA
jgi:hypothetical protein